MLYTIGDFAARTGLTPRALRLYDGLGLLPARRDPNDHRYYTDDDIAPARRIALLRAAGFPLSDIADLLVVLGDPGEVQAVVGAFEARLAELARSRDEIARQQRTIGRLIALLRAAPDAGGELSRLASVSPGDRREMMQTLYTQSAKLSARGPRARNEDATWAERTAGGGLYVVADGMGGHERGADASALACRIVSERFDPSQLGPDRWAHHLGAIVAAANEAVHALETGGIHAGTTLTVLALHEGVAFVTSVGDSRVYRLDGGALVQITRDHTVVQRRHDAGELAAHELHAHPERNLLTSCVGCDATVPEIFFHREEIPPGARYLLASDGVTRALPDDEIASALTGRPDADDAVRHLVGLAEARTDDNATAIVVDP